MTEKNRLTFSRICFCNLKRTPYRTACLVLLVAILSFVLFGGTFIGYSFSSGVNGLSHQLGADILIVPKGYDKNLEGSLLYGEPGTFYMETDWAERISEIEGIKTVSSQLLIASLSGDCCDAPMQLIGYDQDTDFVIGPWIKNAMPNNLGTDEIVVGSSILAKPGDTLVFFSRDYRVVAKMDSTNTGYDASVFMGMGSARIVAADYVEKGGMFPPPDGTISTISVLVEDGYSASEISNNINNQYYDEHGIEAISANKIISGVSENLRIIVLFISVLSAALWVISIIILSIIFSVIINERKREFGILRSVGVTKQKLAGLILLESGIVSFLGSILGIFLSAILTLSFRVYIQGALHMPYVRLSLLQLILIGAVSFILSFISGPLSSLLSTTKIARTEPSVMIREGYL